MLEHVLPEGKILDLENELAKISAQVSWCADAMEALCENPGADLVLRSIEEQLNALLTPIARMQREHRILTATEPTMASADI